MDLIPIGQAADRLGLSPSALRYYEIAGWFPRRRGRPGDGCTDSTSYRDSRSSRSLTGWGCDQLAAEHT